MKTHPTRNHPSLSSTHTSPCLTFTLSLNEQSSTMARLRHFVPLMLQCVAAFEVRQGQTVRNRHRLGFLVQSEVPRAEKGEGSQALEDSPRASLGPSPSFVDVENGGCVASSNLSPVLQSLVDERREYQLNLGRAMDTLRTDMQDILSKTPGWCNPNLLVCTSVWSANSLQSTLPPSLSLTHIHLISFDNRF